eukprot:s4792_g7.t2
MAYWKLASDVAFSSTISDQGGQKHFSCSVPCQRPTATPMWCLTPGLCNAACVGELLSEMVNVEVPPDAKSCTAAIRTCADVTLWQHALDFLILMPDIQVPSNTVACNSVLSTPAAEAAGKLLWPSWPRRSSALKAKVAPNVVTYGAAISACDKGSQWQQSLDLLKLMARRKALPDRVCAVASEIGFPEKSVCVRFSSATSACGRALRWDQALALLASMPAMQLVPDFVSRSTVIAACASALNWSKALSMALALREEAGSALLILSGNIW